jgi:hypothetical protein
MMLRKNHDRKNDARDRGGKADKLNKASKEQGETSENPNEWIRLRVDFPL